AAIGVAVVGDAQVCTVLQHSGLQLLQVGGAVAVIDVDAIWLGTNYDGFCAGGLEDFWGATRGCAVGAVQDYLQPFKAVWQCLQQVHDVAVFSVSETRYSAYLSCSWAWLWHLQAGFDGVFQRIVQLLAAAGQELNTVIRSRVVR